MESAQGLLLNYGTTLKCRFYELILFTWPTLFSKRSAHENRPSFLRSLGPCSVYSMVDGSWQGFFCNVGGKKIKIKSCLPNIVGGKTLSSFCMSEEKKKINEQRKTDCSTMLWTMINVLCVYYNCWVHMSQFCLVFLGPFCLEWLIIFLLFLKGKTSKNSRLYVEGNKIKMLRNNVGGKKEKTLKVQFFFLVGDNLS